MDPNSVLSEYLNLLDARREAIFAQLARVEVARLWRRLGPKEWSAGEHLAHATAAPRSFRQMFQLF